MSDRVACLSLLSKVHFENGNWQEAAADLAQARETQMRIVTKPPSEIVNPTEEKKLAAKYFI